MENLHPAVMVVVVLAGLWLLVAAAGFVPILLLRFTSFRPVADPEPVIRKALAVVDPDWLDAAGFEPQGAIRPLGIPIAMFGHADGRAAFVVYFANNKAVVDFVSDFPNHVALTTTSTADGLTAPLSPGSTMQCLPGRNPAELWEAHRDGLDVLRSHLAVDTIPLGLIDEAMREGVIRQGNNLLTRPWLILTIPYRYAVLRFRRRGVTIAEQIERGIIKPEALGVRARGV